MRLVMTLIGLFAIGFLAIPSYGQTSTIPISEELSLEKTTVLMSIPEDEALKWGSVKGKVENAAERYPVIIQFYKGDEPVHVAQVDLKGDDSFEYKFRIRNVVDGQQIDIFEGNYVVKIFAVVQNANTI